MIGNDDVVYVPFAFGYVNYASRTEEPHLRFADAPTPSAAGALLGGAGIGVSAQSKHREAAIEYAMFLCSPEMQRGDYVTAGGQPGSLSAWQDDAVNASTRISLPTRCGRSRHPTSGRRIHGFIGFFRDSAPRVAAAIAGEMSPADLAEWVNRRYRESRPSMQSARSVA